MATAAFWSTDGRTWHIGNAAPPAYDPDPDGAEELFDLILEDSPGAYARFAQNHLEMSPSEAALSAVCQSHPLDPSTLSAHSRVEQGPAAEETAVHLAADLRRLNEAYERTFGVRFVVFVAGRPRAAILPLMEAALVADRDEELRRGLHDVVAIAADRARRS